MKQESQPSNVKCIKCNCWMWVEWTKKTEEGYICNKCLKKQENEKVLEEFQKVGEANFGSKGLE